MNFFKKLFGKKEEEFQPDNSVLLKLLKGYNKNPSNDTYKLVYEELQGNRAILYVPSEHDVKNQNTEWETAKKDTEIGFTSVFNLDGLLVFGVFTSEEAILKWSKKETTYVAMPAKVVLEIAKKNNFNRVVIDSDQETMFVLERNVSNSNKVEIEKETEVLIWYPKNPISGAHKKQLCTAFSKVSSIKEVFHFGMTRNNEQIFILAFVLEEINENSKLAVLSAMNDGMLGFDMEFPLEILYVKEGDHWYETGSNFDVFYKR